MQLASCSFSPYLIPNLTFDPGDAVDGVSRRRTRYDEGPPRHGRLLTHGADLGRTVHIEACHVRSLTGTIRGRARVRPAIRHVHGANVHMADDVSFC
ncbi:hypothetical protein E2C01_087303 [Portunus trituberculatus]|uniref:Uncharacterized protein n=1 Tax=Portunus trituberculatus TaxID=210409 RepID=A0A5B7JDP7_PORTR|nr:hypothetical protein [Portunus trituberculatus]